MKSGIYKITCKITGRIYIGSSSNIQKRWKQHKRGCKQYIHKHIKKYGIENMIFEVIEYCELSCIIEREQYYLDTILKANEAIGNTTFYKISLNKRPKAEKNTGFINAPRNYKKVAEYDRETGDLLRTYNSAKEYAFYHGIQMSTATKRIRNYNTYYNEKYNIVTYYTDTPFKKITLPQKRKRVVFYSDERRKKIAEQSRLNKNSRKPVAIIDENETIIETFDSMTDLSKKYKISMITITRSINGSTFKKIKPLKNKKIILLPRPPRRPLQHRD